MTAATDLAREWLHLVARFFDVVGSRPLTPAEQVEVDRWLASEVEREAFWDQPVADQRHGLTSARHVAAHAQDRPELIRAALLHDVGKRHARLGVVGRSLAGAARSIGLRPAGRMGQYLDHGPLAAEELAAGGGSDLVCEFARHHHDARPPTIAAADWDLLQAADHVR